MSIEAVYGLLTGGGIASIAAVVQNARTNKVTSKVEANKTAIDGFDRLTARLETRTMAAEARETTLQKLYDAAEITCAAEIAAKDLEIARAYEAAELRHAATLAAKDLEITELKRQLKEKRP